MTVWTALGAIVAALGIGAGMRGYLGATVSNLPSPARLGGLITRRAAPLPKGDRSWS